MRKTLRTAAALGLAGLLAFSATGCAKRTIDPETTGSVSIPGTDGSLRKFCDGTILIYWTPSIASGEDDEYEFIVYDGCDANGNIINGAGKRDINPGTPPSGQPRTEDLQDGGDEED
jgi:hypothetical protein